jgi:hypothetical protein
MSVSGAALELQVADHDLGSEVRTINSLSGGEIFLVSLALALGLSGIPSWARLRLPSVLNQAAFNGVVAAQTCLCFSEASNGQFEFGIVPASRPEALQRGLQVGFDFMRALLNKALNGLVDQSIEGPLRKLGEHGQPRLESRIQPEGCSLGRVARNHGWLPGRWDAS